jgi:hypothetical protein
LEQAKKAKIKAEEDKKKMAKNAEMGDREEMLRLEKEDLEDMEK